MALRSLLAVVAIVAISKSALPSQAQTWPERSVKLIVPLGPGSGVDITARLLASRLSSKRCAQNCSGGRRIAANRVGDANGFAPLPCAGQVAIPVAARL